MTDLPPRPAAGRAHARLGLHGTALALGSILGACASLPQGASGADEAAPSADEIAAELSNPTAALGSLSSNFDFHWQVRLTITPVVKLPWSD